MSSQPSCRLEQNTLVQSGAVTFVPICNPNAWSINCGQVPEIPGNAQADPNKQVEYHEPLLAEYQTKPVEYQPGRPEDYHTTDYPASKPMEYSASRPVEYQTPGPIEHDTSQNAEQAKTTEYQNTKDYPIVSHVDYPIVREVEFQESHEVQYLNPEPEVYVSRLQEQPAMNTMDQHSPSKLMKYLLSKPESHPPRCIRNDSSKPQGYQVSRAEDCQSSKAWEYRPLLPTNNDALEAQAPTLTSLEVRGDVEVLWFDGLVYLTIYKGQKKVCSIKLEFEDGTEITAKSDTLYTHEKSVLKVVDQESHSDLPNPENPGEQHHSESDTDVETSDLNLDRREEKPEVSSPGSPCAPLAPEKPPPRALRKVKLKPFACKKRSKALPSREHKGGLQKLHRCDVCAFSVTRADLLDRHKAKDHSLDKQHICITCNKSFATMREYHRHVKVHNPDKAYVCQYCRKAFNRYSYLKCHIRIHTGEKPFKCSDCAMCFTQKTHLVDHRRRAHTKERPFTCEVCGNRFFAATDLKQHSVVHTGLKSYKCPLCDKMFSQRCNLHRHRLTHTGEKPFVCEVCGKQFTRLQYLRDHANIHNNS